MDERLTRAREAYRLEKEAHRRTMEELQKLQEKVAKLEAKARNYEVGAQCDGDGETRFQTLEEMVECKDDAMNEDIGDGEGGQTKVVACAEDAVEAESRTLPEPGALEGEDEDEANRETARSEGCSQQASGEDVEPSSAQNKEDIQGSASSSVSAMRMVNEGGRRASTVVTRMKSRPRARKASALQVSPYTNPLTRRMGRHRGQMKGSVTRGRGVRFGMTYRRKVSTDNEMVSGRGPPVTEATVTKTKETEVSALLEY